MNLLFQTKNLSEQDTVLTIMFIGAVVLYFVPSIIGLLRMKKNLVAIIALNFFLGWSVVGWVVSLVWSLSSDSKPAKIIVNQQAPVVKEDRIDKLGKLKKLLDDGAINQKEFDQQKASILKNS